MTEHDKVLHVLKCLATHTEELLGNLELPQLRVALCIQLTDGQILHVENFDSDPETCIDFARALVGDGEQTTYPAFDARNSQA